jgi:hypothetical protein
LTISQADVSTASGMTFISDARGSTDTFAALGSVNDLQPSDFVLGGTVDTTTPDGGAAATTEPDGSQGALSTDDSNTNTVEGVFKP